MKPLCVGLAWVALAVAPALAQKPEAPASKKPAVAMPAAKPAAKPQVKPKPEARPVRRVVPAPVPEPAPLSIGVYQGDVPTDPGMRSWQPAPRGQR
jgi:hypothetical protein